MNLTERVKTAIKHRNNFSLSYEGVLTANFGDIIPIVAKEMVPTDIFNVQSQAFFRLAPLATPTFGKIHGYINSFFVPYRILMPENEFEDSMTGGAQGDYPETFPFISFHALYHIYRILVENGDAGSPKRMRKLLSYLGLGDILIDIERTLTRLRDDYGDNSQQETEYLQLLNKPSHSVSLLPFLAIFRIFYDYYVPMNLEDDWDYRNIFTNKYSGLITYSSSDELEILELAFDLLCSCYNKDYFTMAMQSAQRGSAQSVNVGSTGNATYDKIESEQIYGNTSNSKTLSLGAFTTSSTSSLDVTRIESNGGDRSITIDSDGNGIITNLTLLSNKFKVQSLRWAEKIQAFLERNNIAGGRYFEQMAARFGVKLSPKQLQRSEYLGGDDFFIQVSDVTSTSDTDNASLGDMAGKGIGLGKRNASYHADEYGIFISLMHFVPETFGLVDGLDRMWTRHSRFDYYQPELEDTGMQPVYNKELNIHLLSMGNVNGGNHPDGVFGYNPRFAEYKTANPILGGDFILHHDANTDIYSDAVLSSMNLFRRIGINDFNTDGFSYDAETPVLNRDFVSILGLDAGQNNFNRVFQNTTDDFDHFFINTQISIGANRPMIGYAEAGLEFSHEDSGNGSVTLAYGGMRK